MRRHLCFIRRVLVLGGFSLLLGQTAARAQLANVARGFSPSGMFDMGGFDAVNGFNGNLVIRIPIGKSYPVGGTLGSYALQLIYNSNAWNYMQVPGTPCPQNGAPFDTVNYPSPFDDNAGLGWSFTFGYVATDPPPYSSPPPPSTFAYHGMDGSVHYLLDHLTTAQGGQVQQTGMLFSDDGSYLRYNQSTGSLEFPDGHVQVFGNGTSTIKDQFGNGLTITSMTDPQTCPGTIWVAQDGSRTHRVCFRPTGYTGAYEQTEVIDHIDVAAFSGSTPSGTATYKFFYNDEDTTGFHEVRLSGFGTKIYGCTNPQPPRVYLLTKLLLPNGTSYSMPVTQYTDTNQYGTFPGVLKGMSLPTSGSIGWEYEVKSLPSPHSDENGLWYVPTVSAVPGVKTRSLYQDNRQQQLVGTWQYNQGTAGVTPLLNEMVNETVYPSPDPVLASQGATGHRVVTYYEACVYGTCSDEPGGPTYAADFGMPFSRRRPDGTGRYLSQETYPSATALAPLRQIYLNYENDMAAPPPADVRTPVYANERLQGQRTVYMDDPVPGSSSLTAVATASSNYDGLGHYRTTVTSDTTRFHTQRTETVDWNPGPMPSPSDSWILDTYDFKQQQEGGDLEQQETRFEPGTGFVLCQRRLKSGANRGRHDVVVTYGHDAAGAAGNVTEENWYGGDGEAVSAAAGCTGLQNPVSSYSHTYSAGVRSSTRLQVTDLNGVKSTLKVLDDDVDASSGLVSTSRDSAGHPTSFTYDSMGRLLSTAPQGDAATYVTYTLSDASPPAIDLVVGGGLEEESWQLDGLGRTIAHTVRMPYGTSITSLVTLNAMGWKTFESEPSHHPGSPGTSYLDYDPFGRPQRIMTADKKTSYLGYQGITSIVRTQAVWNGTREYPYNTREEYDGLGRLQRIQDPSGVWTRYRYDVGGRLKTVTTDGERSGRSFAYDGRGFLVSETNKESGTTTYQHEVRGILIQKQTPTGNLLMQVDEAGRLLGVMSPQGTLLRQFTYGTTGTDAGKLMEAQAFNFRMGSSCSSTEVRQQYHYDATSGRLASEATSLLQGSSQLESWTQSYAYDGAGRITQVNYPSCTNLCPAPARQVTTIYSYGRPTSVSGFANPITYNDNGTLLGITHANQVAFTETADPNGMLRPGSMRVDAPPPGNTMPWPQESYSYDTAGNVKAIGGKSFAYDADSRVVAATVPAAVTQPYEGFAYDAYGNLISVARGANSGSATTVFFNADPDTNRLTGARYDDSGEVTLFPLVQGTQYTWDVFGQLTSVNTGTEIWTHIYDAAGERVWSYRTAPSRLDNYMLRGQDEKVLSAFTKVGSTYTWEDYAYREGELLGAALSNGTVMHFDVDHLGSVRLETDGSRSIVRYHDFWPYGDEATPLTGSGSERMKSVGQEWDLGVLTAAGDNASTQDDAAYMHARYYRPIFGRFLSADPHAGSAAAPQTWNRYSYAAGNPLRFTDPTGKYLCSDTAACKQFEDARQQSLNDPATREAAAAYGELNQDNGVTVKFEKPEEGQGDTGGRIEANKEGTAMVAKVTVRITPGTKGVVLEALAAHEGTHVLNWEKWAASWDMNTAKGDMSKNPTNYDNEFAANQATQRVFARHQQTVQFGQCKGCQLGVVNHTPAEVAAAIRRILADPRGIYNLTPENPRGRGLMDPTQWQ